jgi:cobalt/nickel transport system ATP-binding protein
MSAPALLTMQAVQVQRAGLDILTGASFSLLPGERLAIVGPNGAGKTTLLRALVGLQPTAAGSITLLGQPCSSEREFRQMRPRIGFLFQDSDDQLFCPSVIEDVSFGPLNLGCTQGEAEARSHAVLESLGIGPLAHRFSHHLSGGEKRLVCLAGLLAMRPDVLLLDEPTNGVDAVNGRRLRQALQTFPGAMILVSHDDSFVLEMATRALLLTDGKLAAAEIHDHPHTHRHLHVHESHGTPARTISNPRFAGFKPLD